MITSKDNSISKLFCYINPALPYNFSFVKPPIRSLSEFKSDIVINDFVDAEGTISVNGDGIISVVITVGGACTISASMVYVILGACGVLLVITTYTEHFSFVLITVDMVVIVLETTQYLV